MTKYYKYNIYLLFTYLLLVFFCTNSFGYEWIKTYGGIGIYWDGGNPMDRTDDGGYVIIGYTITSAYPNYTSDLVLVKTDGNGSEQWRKTLRQGQFNSGYAIQQTIDDGYVITGSTGDGYSSASTLLMKADVNGNKQWSKILSGDTGYSVQQTADGGYIIAGNTTPGGDVQQQWVSLTKTDSNGNEQWSKTFSESAWNWASSVQQTDDGGYIIAGTTSSNDVNYLYQFYLLKTDGNGNKQWSKTFTEYDDNWGYSVQQTDDGGYIIAGNTGSLLGEDPDMCYFIKTNSNGNKQWSKTFGGDDKYTSCSSVQQTNDGGYIIAGDTTPKTVSDWNTDIYLIKTDRNGNKQWSRTFGGSSTDYAISIQQTDDEGYITCGHTNSFGSVELEPYLLYFRPSESKAMPWIPLLLLYE